MLAAISLSAIRRGKEVPKKSQDHGESYKRDFPKCL